MAFALPSLVTGALLTTGVTLSPVLTGAYSNAGLKLTSPIVGAYSNAGLKLTSPIVGAYSGTGELLPQLQTGALASDRDIHLPLLLVGDYRNEITGGTAVMGATALVQMVSNPVITGTAVTTSPVLATWNLGVIAISSAIGSSLATPGQHIFISVTGTGTFSTTAQAPTIFWEVITGSATVADTAVGVRGVDATVTASVVVNGVIVGQASYQVSAISIAQIISGIQFVQDYWDGWVFNLNTNAPSFYENFKFNSFCRIGSDYYGCNDTGIHLLGGDLDGAAEINAVVTTGTSDLSTDHFYGATRKRIPAVYVEARSVEPLNLTCRVEGQEYTYAFRAGSDTVAGARVDLGKGLVGTLWQLELTNTSGADFEIAAMTEVPVATKRRI